MMNICCDQASRILNAGTHLRCNVYDQNNLALELGEREVLTLNVLSG
jgi:hypothetical protein